MFGGGGLFGDLPTAKNNASGDKTGKVEENIHKKQSPSSLSLNNPKKNDENDNTKGPVSKKSVSLVGALGNAGTRMAFVPTSLVRKRNRASTSNSTSTGPFINQTKREKLGASVGNESTESNSLHLSHESTKDTDTLKSSQDGVVKVLDKNECTKNDEDNSTAIVTEISNESTTSTHSSTLAPAPAPAPTPVSPAESSQESEQMRLLHASVTDENRYDPFVPNDLLAYRERKKNERRRDQLEKSARETLRMQQIMREKIEEERKKVEATGDYQKIVENRIKTAIGDTDSNNIIDNNRMEGRGRGRGIGRGVSNLPAWLIKKQEEDKLGSQKVEQESSLSSSSHDILLLSNMTAPGHIDNELVGEVKEECEMQCGPVEFVEVFDADQSHNEVRVFVKFNNILDAQKASKLFHGRRFAHRIISAKMVKKVDMK